MQQWTKSDAEDFGGDGDAMSRASAASVKNVLAITEGTFHDLDLSNQ